MEIVRFRLNAVRSTWYAMMTRMIGEAVAVATPSFNDPQRATM